MTQNLLPLVAAPLHINRLQVANRIVMSSMHLNHEGDDQFERMARFYALRSRNGPGLIVTAGCSPDRAGCARPGGFALDDDRLIPRHQVITDAVHAAGHSRIALQLLHFGREAFHGQLVAPSALKLAGSIYTPAPLNDEQIHQTIASYASAAQRAVAAGYDAIEIVFSQGFLIHQFLSPHTNHRDDAWGGDPGRRMRFARAVARAVRDAVGPDFALVFRLPCLDLIDRGLGFADACALIGSLREAQIDLLNVSIGWHESEVPTLATIVPQAGFASVAARVKQLFPSLLVCVSNRINDLRHAEELLIGGHADMVAMGRPFLADRDIVHKSFQARFEQINACIACNQNCLDHVFLGEEVGCSVDPEAGNRDEGQALPPLSGSPRIAVLGGGLAGMSAALYLARRGARVTLFERQRRLGGQMLLAARIPGKAEFLETVRHYEQQLLAAGVELHLGQSLQASDVGPSGLAGDAWAHVVIATGTEPNPVPELAAATAGLRVYSWHDILTHNVPVAFPVVIIGGGGVACDVAKFLLQRRTRVQLADEYLQKFKAEALVGPLGPLLTPEPELTIVQRSSRKIAYRIGRTTRWIMLGELQRLGVQFIRGGSLQRCDADSVSIEMLDGEQRRLPAQTLVFASGQRTRHAELLQALDAAGIACSLIGAAAAQAARPASISSSIRSGYDCARHLQLDQSSAAVGDVQSRAEHRVPVSP